MEVEENQEENTLAEAAVVTIEESTPKKKKKRERPPPDPTDPAVIAAKAAAHSKNAEAEAAALKAAEEDNKPSKLDECKYYTSLTLGKKAHFSLKWRLHSQVIFRHALHCKRFCFPISGAVCPRPSYFDAHP